MQLTYYFSYYNSAIYIFDGLLDFLDIHMFTHGCVATTSNIVPLSASVDLDTFFTSSPIVGLASVPIAESGDQVSQ